MPRQPDDANVVAEILPSKLFIGSREPGSQIMQEGDSCCHLRTNTHPLRELDNLFFEVDVAKRPAVLIASSRQLV